MLVAEMTPDEAVPAGITSKPLCERVLNTRATVVVLDRSALADPRVVAQAASLHEAGLRVRTIREPRFSSSRGVPDRDIKAFRRRWGNPQVVVVFHAVKEP